jgi:hypothetical protein
LIPEVIAIHDERLTIECDRAGNYTTSRWKQAHDAEGCLGFPGPGLSDEAENLATVNGETHVPDYECVPAVSIRVSNGESIDLEQGGEVCLRLWVMYRIGFGDGCVGFGRTLPILPPDPRT